MFWLYVSEPGPMVLITGQFLDWKYVLEDGLIADNPSHGFIWVTAEGLRIHQK